MCFNCKKTSIIQRQCEKKTKQESPPAWQQEAYRPHCILSLASPHHRGRGILFGRLWGGISLSWSKTWLGYPLSPGKDLEPETKRHSLPHLTWQDHWQDWGLGGIPPPLGKKLETRDQGPVGRAPPIWTDKQSEHITFPILLMRAVINLVNMLRVISYTLQEWGVIHCLLKFSFMSFIVCEISAKSTGNSSKIHILNSKMQ